MIDRHGNKVYVGWSRHEMLWLRAAISLPQAERMAAFRDISDLTGRPLSAIQDKATRVRQQDRLVAASRLVPAEPRRVVIPYRAATRGPRLMPSQLRQPTRAQLMGCR